MIKVCIITSTRADYGLLRNLLRAVDEERNLKLQLVVTGSHLSPEFGYTYNEILEDGLRAEKQVEILVSSDTGVGVAKSMALGMLGFSEAFHSLKPDLLILLGDRFELHAAATSAVCLRIPIMHLHGGELTEGSLDDSFRHSITKLSHLHCVASEPYRRRVIQLGEPPDRVYCVGGLGVDAIKNLELLGKSELEDRLSFGFLSRNLLITFHPSVLDPLPAPSQLSELLSALSKFRDVGLIFTQPNADEGARELTSMIKSFVSEHPNARLYQSLGQVAYISCMAHCDAVVGNSSSGLLEAPTLRKGVVNIGGRQRGRLQAQNIINCGLSSIDIQSSIEEVFSESFQKRLCDVVNPYGSGGAVEKIIDIINTVNIGELNNKIFYDAD